ncbi:protein transport protein Sec31A isoform X2 [Venturia canescens]|uniref:protein transport protein Sec31A isoform X2 n=1 Tax=Venturia canescens TaxID=32260 RepID=UPI001C9D4CFA|nr:protein transport protein Sec31A isoform X2 [Venturia canescens]
MKVKELVKTVNVAWSPQAQHPILLAAGTAAQQLDASFNTSASLDLYSLSLQQPGYDMEIKASVPSDHRFHKVIWGAHNTSPAGILVGGCDYGTVKIYSAAKMLAKESDCLISSPDRHTGPVRALDINPFQSNLLASGASESEIYIWDIVNTNTPMTPGTRSQPPEDVQYIQWNKQVQHILASTFSQRCVIWDLRKNEPIIKLTDANSKIRWKVVQWHPDVATQLCLASEDDQSPVIELWDLRFATSALKTLQGHQRGVLSIAWNPHDPDLLLSCAKDNRILCWNPNSDAPNGEIVCELAQTNQWNFDVSWCPRNPGLVVGSSFDGHAVVYSLLGGQQQGTIETSNKIVDSFPGMDPFTQPPTTVQSEPAVALKKAPKWLKRPFGASFGFGGKLTIFENEPADPNSNNCPNRKVIVSQVITNPELIKRSNDLEEALKSGQFIDYCKGKANVAESEHKKKVWNCVEAYFSDDVTKGLIQLLGYDLDAMNQNLRQFVPQEDIDALADGIAKIDNIQNGNVLDGSATFDAIAQQEQDKKRLATTKVLDSNFKINTSNDEDGLITQAILVGNIEAAVSLCFSTKRYADAIILSMAGGPDLLARTQYKYFAEHSGALNSLINSLVSENWSDIVKNCDITCWKETLVGIFTHSQPEERSLLCDMLGDRLASCDDPNLKKEAQICYISSGNLNKMIEVSESGIQETVELVMIMQKALELRGLKEAPIDGNIASVLSNYAEILSTEGNLEAALNYLGNSQEERISMLRDRLCRALGYTQQVNNQHVAPKAPVTQNYYEQNAPRKSYDNNAYGQVTGQSWNTAPMKSAYGGSTMMNQMNAQQTPNIGLPPIQQQPTIQDQYSGMNSYGQISAQVPPPLPTTGTSLGGSRPPSVGPQSRSKYILDPSVKSTPSYPGYQNQTSMYNPVPPVSAYPSQNSYQPQAPISASGYPNQPQNTMYNPLENDAFKNNPSNIMTPAIPAPQLPPTQSQLYDPNRAQPTQQLQNYNENVYQPGPQPSGWNDPPIGKASRAQAKTEFQSQNPIVHPLHGAMPQQEYNTAPQDQYYRDPQMPYNPQQYNQTVPHSGMQFNKPYEPQQQHQQPIEQARVAEPEKPKAPIPEEHVHLKTVFDELRHQCYETAKNPQTKRKIEDVQRKLEVLYDCLRENSLTPNTLQGLHQIAQMVQSGDYTNGLGVHTQLVSGPDFSRIASFMPGVKVLLQSALQLSVYIT